MKSVKWKFIIPAILAVVYSGTYFISLGAGLSPSLVDYLLALGTLLGIAIFFNSLEPIYYYQMVLFACLAQFVGSMLGVYTLLPFYDVVLHGLSGVLLISFGYKILTWLLEPSPSAALPPIVFAAFAFFFSVACAGIWEIFEFLCDTFLGFQNQGVGVADTMQDIIAGSIGAVLGSLVLYRHLRNKA